MIPAPIFPRIKIKPLQLQELQRLFNFKLSDQGSNLDSSDPETDVLPVTPSDNSSAKVRYFLKLERKSRENIGKDQCL